ncbi:MAG TPA: ABC transporter substrate-binding protein [Reyranella sp.]|nr:ABC transporter substrate-binding protein [Reyranella sp.]
MFARTRAGRRALLFAGLAVVAGIGLVVYGMGLGGRKETTASSVIVIVSEATTPPLDPHRMTGTIGLRIVDAIFDPLVREDMSKETSGAPEIKPALAESWKISPDGLTYSFTIRTTTFHDGSAADAPAVKKNFDRLMDKSSPVYDERAARSLVLITALIESTAAPDARTFVIKLKQPFAGLLRLLTDQRMSIVSAAALDQYKGDELAQHPVGSGPYRIAKFENGGQVELVRNPNFWGGRPKLDRIVFRPIYDPTTAATELQTGAVDMIASAGSQQIEQLKGQKGVTVQYPEPANLYFIRFNLKLAPTDNADFRRALNYAINRDAISALVGGQMTPKYGPVPRGNEIYQKGFAEIYAYDPAKAKALIAQSGVAQPVTLKLMVPISGPGNAMARQVFELIQQDLKAVGVGVEPQYLDFTAMISAESGGYKGVNGSYNGWTTGANAEYWFERMFSGSQQPPRGVNRGYYDNPDVNALFDKGRGEPDDTKRHDLYRAAAKKIAEDAPWLFLYQDRLPRLLGPRVTGVVAAPSIYFDYATLGVK